MKLLLGNDCVNGLAAPQFLYVSMMVVWANEQRHGDTKYEARSHLNAM